MAKLARWLTVLLGLVLALPFALRWLFAPEATSAEHGIALDGYHPQVGVAIVVELVTAGASFATARSLRAVEKLA